MSRIDRRFAFVLTGALFVVLASGACFCLPGKSVAGAWRVMQGDVPYRDFWTMYAPGQFYAVAALLKLFGERVIVPALVACALTALTCALVFALLRRLEVPRSVALIVASVLGLSMFQTSPELSSYPPAFALIVWGWLELVRLVQGDPRAHLARAGLAFGFAAPFKHDIAAYATVGAMLGLALESRCVASENTPNLRQKLRPAKIVVQLGGSAALVVSVCAAWLASVAGRDAWVDLIAFPLGDFSIVRGEPYPGVLPNLDALRDFLADTSRLPRARDAAEILAEWVLGNAPQIAFVGGAIVWMRGRATWDVARSATASILLATMPFFWWAAHTQQNTHFTTLAVSSWCLGALAWSTTDSRWARAFWLALAVFYGCGLAIRPAADLYQPLRVWSEPVPLAVPAAQGLWVSPRERDVYETIAKFVQSRTDANEPVYIGVARHDAIVINNPRWVWVLDRPSATRYHELHPGITDRADVQREMIADLERKRVRCAVIWKFAWEGSVLDAILARRKAALPECGATLLDEYLAENFLPVLEIGEYVVLWRDVER